MIHRLYDVDIVERLRKNDAKAQFSTNQLPPYSIQGEAADEIEKLRHDISRAMANHNADLNTSAPEERATIPEGWTLVPKIANVEMLAELASGITLLVRDQAPAPDLPTLLDRYQGAYTAMLKKASPPPQRVPEGHKDV